MVMTPVLTIRVLTSMQARARELVNAQVELLRLRCARALLHHGPCSPSWTCAWMDLRIDVTRRSCVRICKLTVNGTFRAAARFCSARRCPHIQVHVLLCVSYVGSVAISVGGRGRRPRQISNWWV